MDQTTVMGLSVMGLIFLFFFLPVPIFIFAKKIKPKEITVKCKCGSIFSRVVETIGSETMCPDCKSILSVEDKFWSGCIHSERQPRSWATFLTGLLILTVSLIVGVITMRSPDHLTRPFEKYDYNAATVDVGPAFLAASIPELIVKVTTPAGRILKSLSLNAPTNAMPIVLYVLNRALPSSYTITWSKGKYGEQGIHSIKEETTIFYARITDRVPTSSFPIRITVAVAKPKTTDLNYFEWTTHEATYNYSLDGINRGLVERYRIIVVISTLLILAMVFVMGFAGIMPLSRRSLLMFSIIAVTAFVGGLLSSLITLPSSPNVSEISECMQGVALGFVAWILEMVFLGSAVTVLIKSAVDKARVDGGTMNLAVTSRPPKF
jgi:hypothetical protein